jgi:hypothetical protein
VERFDGSDRRELVMPLQSMWLRGNSRLQRCLISDPSHVTNGDKGDHVTLIQGALFTLGKYRIATSELLQQVYGQSTAAAVLEYKKKRRIINYSYQTSADDIVGRMTIQSLDTDMQAYERSYFSLLLAFGVTVPPQPHGVIISQSDPTARAWAEQVVAANNTNFLPVRASPQGTSQQIVTGIQEAIQLAGPGGLLIVAAGHGVALQDPNAGVFDLVEGAKMRIGGKGAFRDPKAFVDVFYADAPPSGSPSPFSDKQLDEQDPATNRPFGWELRLNRWSKYQDLCQAFVNGKLGLVVLLTCNIGNSLVFLKKVASQWQTPILAYKDFMNYTGFKPHVRAVLDQDFNTPNSGTNVPFSEISIPLTTTEFVVATP